MRFVVLLLLSFTLLFSSRAQPLEKVSLQLQWLDQFQFAGYYIAKQKGFYKDVGLDVTLQKYTNDTDVVKNVVQHKSTYAIGRSSLVKSRAEGYKIVLLAAIFQNSPLELIALKSSQIKTIQDFEHKTIMMTKDASETVAIDAMITTSFIDKGTISYVDHTFDINDLIEKKVDLYAGYSSNEPYILQQKGIKFVEFNPKERGFDFYGDILFTSEDELSNHPKRVAAFRKASLKGWQYAFEHIDESVDLVYKHYNPQHKTRAALLYEAKVLKHLAYTKGVVLGDIEDNKIQRIFDAYKLMGIVSGTIDLEECIYQDIKFTKKEKEYLQKKGEIKICVLPNAKPYSAIEDGKYVGIGAQILELTQKELDIHYKLVDSKSWVESLKKGMNKECDILPIAAKTPSREHFFRFTTPYHYEPLVITTIKGVNYIIDFDTVLDKSFSVSRGQSFIEDLQARYPNVKLTIVESTQEGLQGVLNGKFYGHIDVLIASAYAIKNMAQNSLQISGQFDKKVEVSFGVRKDDPVLFSIFEKLSRDIKPMDLQQILNSWVQVTYTNTTSYKYLYEASTAVVVFFLIFLFKHYVLNKKNKQLQELQTKVLEINQNLEKKIAHAVADLEKAQEVAKTGSWILDIKTKHLKWSKETFKIFEVDSKSVSEEELFEIFLSKVHPEDVEKLQSTYEDSLIFNKPYRVEHRLLMEDGRIKHVLEQCKTIYDKDGEPLLSHGTVQDVTERVLIKEELKRKDDYLLQQSRLAQMGEMLSMIAHQWKQPLGAISATQVAIKTVVKLEKYDLSDPKEREAFYIYLDERLDKIALYVQNLSQIIRDFSTYYKPHTQPSKLYIDDVLTKAFRLVEDMLKSHNIQTEFLLQSDTKIMMHENEFMQVALNIFSNAKDQFVVKEIENPLLKVRSFTKEQKVFIEIEDNAGGVDEAIIDKIFDPYYSTKLDKNGTGLGLYMSKIILKDYHNGDIYVKNGKDGAIFTIIIEVQLDEES